MPTEREARARKGSLWEWLHLDWEKAEKTVTPVFWRSGKVERVCRSPACAETMASLDGEDDLHYLRFLWAELCGKHVNPRRPDEAVRETKGLMVTDAKNLYDKISKPVVVIKGAEKRASIEAVALKENLERGQTDLRWVNGDSMLANSLTKTTEKGQMALFLSLGQRWRITYDEEMKSAKTRRKLGMGPLKVNTNLSRTDIPAPTTREAKDPNTLRTSNQ